MDKTRDIMLDELKVRGLAQVLNVSEIAGQEIIDANDSIALR